MVKVSVVMPVYNTKRFLRDSVNSILNQTLGDLELICVDDGSDDGSLDILYEFAEMDDRVSVFSLDHQGAGNARNFALKYTTGEFLYFMDSDDFLDLNAFEDFCAICESKDLDFLLFKLINYDVDEDRYYENNYYNMPQISSFVKDRVFNYRDLGDLVFKVNSSTCSKFYNRDFVIRSGARFRENSKFNDNQFFWDVIFCAERIFFLDEFYYTRTRHSASLTGSKDEHHVDIIGVHNDIIKLFVKHNQFEKFKSTLYNNKINLVFFRYSEVAEEFKESFYMEMKKDFNNYYNDIDFQNVLNVNSKFIFDSVIISKNVDDFNQLIYHYNLMKNDMISPENKVLSIENFFNSTDEDYKYYYFNIIKNQLKNIDKTTVNSENLIFYNRIINCNNYDEYKIEQRISKINNLFIQLENEKNLLYEYISEDISFENFPEEYNKIFSDISENQQCLKSEFELSLDDSKLNLNKLGNSNILLNEKETLILELINEVDDSRVIIDNRDNLISDLNEKIVNFRSIIVQKDNLISNLTNAVDDRENFIVDLNGKIVNFQSIVVEKDKLISDLSDEVSSCKSIVVEKDKLISDLSDEVGSCKSIVVEKDKLISDLSDEVGSCKSIVVEKDKLISDLSDEVGSCKSIVVEKDKLISDLNEKIRIQEKFLHETKMQLYKLSSENSYLIKKNKSLNSDVVQLKEDLSKNMLIRFSERLNKK